MHQIVDSVLNLFRTDFCGRGELAERQQALKNHLSDLKKVAEEFGLAVVITNQGKRLEFLGSLIS